MRGRAALERRLDALKKEIERPRFLLIRAVLRVHEPAARGQACRCCACPQHPRGSPFATEAEFRVLEELVIDLEKGDRHRRADMDPAAWSEFEVIAASHEVSIRCSRPQLGMLLDDTGRHILAAGSNRSGKTTLGLYWLALQWIRRGGRESRFWLVASTLPKAFRLLQKLFDGTDTSPPVLPAVLIARRPPTARSGDLITKMADGSWIDLRYFEGDPGAERLKSDAIVAALVDEAAHLPGADSLTALKGRCLDAGGRLFLASTPRPNAYIKTAIVDECEKFERLDPATPERAEGRHPGARWRSESLAVPENPWLNPEVIRTELAALDPDDPATQRDFFGKWVTNSGPLWVDYDAEKMNFLHEARFFNELSQAARDDLGVGDHIDVTAIAVKQIAGRQSPHVRGHRATNMRYLLGQDVNRHPLSTVVLSFTARPGDAQERDRWHVWVWDVFVTNSGHTMQHAERLASVRWARVLRPADDVSPYAGACVVVDPTAIVRDPTAHLYGAKPQGLPQVFANAGGFDVRAPAYSPDGARPRLIGREDSHLLVHRVLKERRFHISVRCATLMQSLCEQEAGPDGVAPLKTSHDQADILASPIDALRYALWAAAHGGRPQGSIRSGAEVGA